MTYGSEQTTGLSVETRPNKCVSASRFETSERHRGEALDSRNGLYSEVLQLSMILESLQPPNESSEYRRFCESASQRLTGGSEPGTSVVSHIRARPPHRRRPVRPNGKPVLSFRGTWEKECTRARGRSIGLRALLRAERHNCRLQEMRIQGNALYGSDLP